jgi:hypothetical protein
MLVNVNRSTETLTDYKKVWLVGVSIQGKVSTTSLEVATTGEHLWGIMSALLYIIIITRENLARAVGGGRINITTRAQRGKVGGDLATIQGTWGKAKGHRVANDAFSGQSQKEAKEWLLMNIGMKVPVVRVQSLARLLAIGTSVAAAVTTTTTTTVP